MENTMSDAADLNRKIASLTEVVNTLERRIASFSHQNACNGYKDNNGLDLEEKVLALEDAVNVLEQNMKQVIPTEYLQGAASVTHRFVMDHPYLTAGTAVGLAAGTYCMLPSGNRTPEDLRMQSIELSPGVRTSAMSPDGNLNCEIFDDVKTLYDGFQRGLKVSGNGPCCGSRTGPNDSWVWLRYGDVLERARLVGSGLVHLGLKPNDQSLVGIFSNNCPQWLITEQACNMFSMVVVPLYDTLGADACTFIVNQTAMEVVFCDKQAKVEELLKHAKKMPSLKRIIVFDDITNNNKNKAHESNIQLFSLSQLEEYGLSHQKNPVPPAPNQLATICYTSGTTGNPKGVMLSHEALVADYSAAFLFSQVNLQPSDVHLSYLPLAHMFERAVMSGLLASGARVGFFRGDVKLLLDDLKSLQPTIWPTVPRLLNRIYDKVMAGAHGIKGAILNLALRRKTALLESGVISNNTIWDKLVFHKVQELTGGRIRWMVVGSAPLAANVLTFARCAFGCTLVEGFGQTEAVAAVTMTHRLDTTAGHVGCPLPCNLVKLCDVPEMDYYAKDNRGEVCIKGKNVMMGYYKDPEKTAEAIDKDGWLHTGDVGMWQDNGTLKIIDRRKHIFKLAQGEYVAPEKLEGIYTRVSLIAQIFVDGDGLETYTVAIAVPDEEVVLRWASDNGMKGRYEEICNSDKLRRAIFADCVKVGKQAKLKGFEQIGNIRLHSELFSVENNLLTPTFKSKRPALRRFFEKDIKAMYTEGRL